MVMWRCQFGILIPSKKWQTLHETHGQPLLGIYSQDVLSCLACWYFGCETQHNPLCHLPCSFEVSLTPELAPSPFGCNGTARSRHSIIVCGCDMRRQDRCWDRYRRYHNAGGRRLFYKHPLTPELAQSPFGCNDTARSRHSHQQNVGTDICIYNGI